MKTAKEVAEKVLNDWIEDNEDGTGVHVPTYMLDEDIIAWMVDAIEADRAGRNRDISDIDSRVWRWGNEVVAKMSSFGDEWDAEIAEFERITNGE